MNLIHFGLISKINTPLNYNTMDIPLLTAKTYGLLARSIDPLADKNKFYNITKASLLTITTTTYPKAELLSIAQTRMLIMDRIRKSLQDYGDLIVLQGDSGICIPNPTTFRGWKDYRWEIMDRGIYIGTRAGV